MAFKEVAYYTIAKLFDDNLAFPVRITIATAHPVCVLCLVLINRHMFYIVVVYFDSKVEGLRKLNSLFLK